MQLLTSVAEGYAHAGSSALSRATTLEKEVAKLSQEKKDWESSKAAWEAEKKQLQDRLNLLETREGRAKTKMLTLRGERDTALTEKKQALTEKREVMLRHLHLQRRFEGYAQRIIERFKKTKYCDLMVVDTSASYYKIGYHQCRRDVLKRVAEGKRPCPPHMGSESDDDYDSEGRDEALEGFAEPEMELPTAEVNSPIEQVVYPEVMDDFLCEIGERPQGAEQAGLTSMAADDEVISRATVSGEERAEQDPSAAGAGEQAEVQGDGAGEEINVVD